jgi:hypothetical protein
MRIRIGKKQRAILTRLDLVGPFDYDELSRNDKRGIKSLYRQGKLRVVRRGPFRFVEAIKPA